jgi:UDPglucose 6-dehydrogenase
VHDVNEEQKHLVATRLRDALGSDLRGKVIAVWGLAFKPNTDDVREAPSLVLIREVVDVGARVRAYDPQARHTAAKSLEELKQRIEYCDSAHQACEGADALVVLTEWLEFRSPDFGWLARTLRARVLVDGRNLYEPRIARAAGLAYYGVGRAPGR